MWKTKWPVSLYPRISPSNHKMKTDSKLERRPAWPMEKSAFFWEEKKKNFLLHRGTGNKKTAYIIKVLTLTF